MALENDFLIKERVAINIDCYFKLQKLVDYFNNGFINSEFDLELLYDNRIHNSLWTNILNREFIYLYQWATKRIIYSNNIQEINNRKAFIFLPYYGITLHAIRRILPWVFLNYEINIIVSDTEIIKAKNKLSYLMKYFSTDTINIITKNEFSIIKEYPGQFILFTGKSNTLNLIREKYRESEIIGATGDFAICIFQDMNSSKLKPNLITPSCTTIKYEFLIQNEFLLDERQNKVPLTFVRELNPTVIYCDFNLDIFNEYKIINLKQDNHDLKGICADPINGYKGDYKI